MPCVLCCFFYLQDPAVENGGSESPEHQDNIPRQISQKVAATIKQRNKEKKKRKLKRLFKIHMKRKIQL